MSPEQEPDWEAFATEEEALAFAAEMTALVLASEPPYDWGDEGPPTHDRP